MCSGGDSGHCVETGLDRDKMAMGITIRRIFQKSKEGRMRVDCLSTAAVCRAQGCSWTEPVGDRTCRTSSGCGWGCVGRSLDPGGALGFCFLMCRNGGALP